MFLSWNCSEHKCSRMEDSKFGFFVILLGLLLAEIPESRGESSTCLAVYREGGAPAVFQSPKCPQWKLSDYTSHPRTAACQSAMHQGQRRSQEDRTLCTLDVRIPFLGTAGLTEVKVGILAVFDGHNGAEASEMASKLLLEYFVLHTYFLLDAAYSVLLKESPLRLLNIGGQNVFHGALNGRKELNHRGSDLRRFKFTLPKPSDGSFCLEIIKESLLRAIHDIDVTFSEEAARKNISSGSTAAVILIADGHVLVANVGDSKALLCSEKFQSPGEAKATLLRLYTKKRSDGGISPVRDFARLKLKTTNGLAHFIVTELTRDHHPDREDERSRVESAGGHISEWGGVFRVNGQLAVSRAIGDLSFKSYGVTASPEVTNWQLLTTNASYLVAATDGIFEKLSPQDLCDFLWELHNEGTVRSDSSFECPGSLADCIVNAAFQKGSMDNMAVVVVPLRSNWSSQTSLKRLCDIESDVNCTELGQQKIIYGLPGNYATYDQEEDMHAHPFTSKLDRLLVEGNHGSFGCFYLSENLNDNIDGAIGVGKKDQSDLLQPLSVPDHHYVGPIDLYRDGSMCFHFGVTTDGINGQCSNSEGFDNFISLLESIPFQSGYNTFGADLPDSRFVLRKRFGRGAFGEVWLAFSWDCSQGYNASEWNFGSKRYSLNTSYHHSCDKNIGSSSSRNCGDASDENLFILKRIMVEKGITTYLSGLREKYFGELFLNVSTYIGGSLVDQVSSNYDTEGDGYELAELRHSGAEALGITWDFETRDLRNNILDGHVLEKGLNHIARYVESFESRYKDIWLVFRHEGVSLSKLMYTVEETDNNTGEEKSEGIKHIQILHPSKWWHWLKTTEAGREEMRNIIQQLLMALKSCHDRNITHRDVKPENMIICFEDPVTGKCLKGSPSEDKKHTTKMRIIDFGSAIDKHTVKHLYGSVGPSRAEQTYEYMPPEALLNSSWYQGPTRNTLKYDMWSVGVVMLELILGSPNVFQINALTRTLLDQHLEGWNDELKELAYKLRSFMELCLLVPGGSSKHHRVGSTSDSVGGLPASWKCSEEFFSLQVKNRDPLHLGFPNVLALRLVRQLLLWDPEDRLSVDEALRHPYFQPLPN